MASLYRATADGHPERSFRYRNSNQPQGLVMSCGGVLAGHGNWGFGILWRGESAQPFSVVEERLLRALSTPIGDAFRRSVAVWGPCVVPRPRRRRGQVFTQAVVGAGLAVAVPDLTEQCQGSDVMLARTAVQSPVMKRRAQVCQCVGLARPVAERRVQVKRLVMV